MDRRRFLAQGLAASSACAMPLSLFAKGSTGDHIYLRSGNISTREFKLALKEAESQGRGVLLHPSSVINLSENIQVGVSVTGSGGKIRIADEAQLTFVNPKEGTQVITGVVFEGAVSFKNSKHQIVSRNSFNQGPSAHSVVNFQFNENKVDTKEGHGLYISHDIESTISHNSISLYGAGHFICLEESMKASLVENQFGNKTSGLKPSLIVKNNSEINPQIELKNNNLV